MNIRMKKLLRFAIIPLALLVAACTEKEETSDERVTGVTLSESEVEILGRQTVALTAVVTPEQASDKTVTWSSSNKLIAAVNQQGEVSGVSVGKATIIATAVNGKKAACTVSVLPLWPEDIRLEPATLVMYLNESATVTTVLSPEGALFSATWSSSNEAVATVNETSGEITAVSLGEATITVTTDNGLQASCAVTVDKKAPTGVQIIDPEVYLGTGLVTLLKATVLPFPGAVQEVTWSSSNTDVVTINAATGEATGVTPGTATLTAAAADNPAITATCTAIVARMIQLTGSTAPSLTLTYTDGSTEELTIQDGRALFTGSQKIIKSLTPKNGSPILIGRKAESSIGLKFNGASLVLRDAVDGVIPIGTYAEFQLINGALGKSYKLEADLDLMSQPWTPISVFTGTFDGDRHTVANLFINTNAGNQGLFGEINGATIKNIGVMSGSVTSTSGGAASVAGLVGRLNGSSVIYACFNNADVTGLANQTGGLVGYAIFPDGAQIIACYNTGDVQAGSFIGGIVGYQHQGTLDVIACYNTGNITASGSMAAGIHSSATASKMIACYNTGIITKGSSIGSNGTACYSANNTSKNNATEFSATAWPSTTANAEWGVGDGSGSGTYWKSLGGWNGGSPTYPKLFFE
jgi:uncharacterized protein YjdB